MNKSSIIIIAVVGCGVVLVVLLLLLAVTASISQRCKNYKIYAPKLKKIDFVVEFYEKNIPEMKNQGS